MNRTAAVSTHALTLSDYPHWPSVGVRPGYLQSGAQVHRVDGIEFAKRLSLETTRQVLSGCLLTLAELPALSGEIRESLRLSAQACEEATDLTSADLAGRGAAKAAEAAWRSVEGSDRLRARNAETAAWGAVEAVAWCVTTRLTKDPENAANNAARSAALCAAWSVESSGRATDAPLVLSAKIAADILAALTPGETASPSH